MFADEYWNIQTKTMESEFFELSFDFENLENKLQSNEWKNVRRVTW